MNLQKAIDILAQYRRDGEPHDLQDLDDSIDLAIEALKRLQQCRVGNPANVELPLPGETDE